IPDAGTVADPVCSCRDCFFGDCKLKQIGVAPLDWGTSGPNDSPDGGFGYADDPLLDRDSVGDDPLFETITIEAPFPGDYEVFAHYITAGSTAGDVAATVAIYVGPSLVGGPWTLVLPKPTNNQTTLWHAATIHWN